MLEIGAVVSTVGGARLLAPVINDLYAASKKEVRDYVSSWRAKGVDQDIEHNLKTIENIKTLWSKDADVYIPNFYYPSKIVCKENSIDINNIFDLPSGNIVIQGIVGQGKSIFMRHLASEAIRDEFNRKIPIFIELRTITKSHSLIDAIYNNLFINKDDPGHSLCHYILESGKAVLLLDGFDETKEDQVENVLQDISNLSSKYRNLKIIVSSRPDHDIQKTSGFNAYNLGQLSVDDIEPFLKKLKVSIDKIVDIKSAITADNDRIAALISTPLMLTLVAIVYESENEIPNTLPDFFEKLFQVVFSSHDRQKARFSRVTHSKLSEQKLMRLFEAFCFMVTNFKYGRTVSYGNFVNAFDKAIEGQVAISCEVEGFRKDITKVTCLMMEEGINDTTFLHKSILEYYTAAYIRRFTDEVAVKFYHVARDDFRKWEPILFFLKDIDNYRYIKHYKKPISEKIIDQINEITCEEQNSNSKLNAFFEEIHEDIGVCFHYQQGDDDNRVESIGPFSIKSVVHEKIIDLISDALDSMIPESISKSQWTKIVNTKSKPPTSKNRTTKTAFLKARHVFDIFDKTPILRALGTCHEILTKEIAADSEIINKIDKQMDVFKINDK